MSFQFGTGLQTSSVDRVDSTTLTVIFVLSHSWQRIRACRRIFIAKLLRCKVSAGHSGPHNDSLHVLVKNGLTCDIDNFNSSRNGAALDETLTETLSFASSRHCDLALQLEQTHSAFALVRRY